MVTINESNGQNSPTIEAVGKAYYLLSFRQLADYKHCRSFMRCYYKGTWLGHKPPSLGPSSV